MIRSEAAGGQHAVDMRMMLQSLVPGMEHAEEANLSSKVPGIAGDLQQSCSTGVKQQVDRSAVYSAMPAEPVPAAG